MEVLLVARLHRSKAGDVLAEVGGVVAEGARLVAMALAQAELSVFADWAVAEVVALVVVLLSLHLHYNIICIFGHAYLLVLQRILRAGLGVVLPALNE